MKILILVASYRPGAGDQGVYAHRLANGLHRSGHDVTLLVSEQEHTGSAEAEAGLSVLAAPTLLRVGSLACLPTLGLLAARLIVQHDVVNLHVPQWGAAGSAAWSRLMRKPLVVTYHRDISPPSGWLNALVGAGVRLGSRAAVRLADRLVCATQDLATASSLGQSAAGKTEVIPPPAEVAEIGDGAVAAFGKMHGLDEGQPVIGMAARLAAGSGTDVLLRALPRVLETYPEAHVAFAGQYWEVGREAAYARRLAPLFRDYEDHWTFLGELRPAKMAAFYRNLDVFVALGRDLSETSALAQVEAMLCGKPSVAADVPGLRHPVKQSGMGKVIPVGDSEALADAVVEVIGDREAYVRPRGEIEALWSTERTVAEYQALFHRLC